MRIRLTQRIMVAAFWLLTNYAQAQRSGFVRADEPGNVALFMGAGIANYLGDLNGRTAFRRGEVGLALSAGLSCRLSDHLTARGEVRIVRLAGSQIGTKQETNNLSFRSVNPEVSSGLLFELLPATARPVINPYLAVGLGFTYLSPTAQYEGSRVSLAPLNTEGEEYSRLALLVYGGLGVSVRLPNRLLLSVEVNHTLPSSDYVDDVSTVYPYGSSLRGNTAIVLSDRRPELGLPTREPGTRRGFTAGKDTYLTGLVRLAIPLSTAKERQYRREVNCVR